MLNLRTIAALACSLFAAAMLAVSPTAADRPERPIRVVVPFNAGGSTDLLVRNITADMVATRFAERSAADWMPDLAANRVPSALVDDYVGALEEEQVRYRGLVRECSTPSPAQSASSARHGSLTTPTWRRCLRPEERRSKAGAAQ